MHCTFCSIIQRNAPVSEVCRDDRALAFMDIQPINPGHVLVVPVRHVAGLAELDSELAEHLFGLAQRIAVAIRSSGVRVEGVNVLLADGEAAGQEVPHIHLHVIPRFPGDGFRFQFRPGTPEVPAREDLDEVARRISSIMAGA